MKIIIGHKGIKREIGSPGFDIAGTERDLRLVANTILAELDKDRFAYGWIEIREYEPQGATNTSPIPWDAGQVGHNQ